MNGLHLITTETGEVLTLESAPQGLPIEDENGVTLYLVLTEMLPHG